MKSQMKGAAPTFRRSVRLKKREAFSPFTSARASSDTDTEETDRTQPGMSLEEGCRKFPSLFGKFKALSRYNVKLLVS